MDKPWKVIFAFVGIFIAGAVFGGFFTLRTNGARPAGETPTARQEPPRAGGANQQIAPALLRQLGQRLKLTDEQRQKIQPIVARAEEDLQRLRRQNFQDTTRVMEQMHADVSRWLTTEQRDELETMKRNMRDRLRRAQENKDRRGEMIRGGVQSNATSTPRPPGDATAADDRKGN